MASATPNKTSWGNIKALLIRVPQNKNLCECVRLCEYYTFAFTVQPLSAHTHDWMGHFFTDKSSGNKRALQLPLKTLDIRGKQLPLGCEGASVMPNWLFGQGLIIQIWTLTFYSSKQSSVCSFTYTHRHDLQERLSWQAEDKINISVDVTFSSLISAMEIAL